MDRQITSPCQSNDTDWPLNFQFALPHGYKLTVSRPHSFPAGHQKHPDKNSLSIHRPDIPHIPGEEFPLSEYTIPVVRSQHPFHQKTDHIGRNQKEAVFSRHGNLAFANLCAHSVFHAPQPLHQWFLREAFQRQSGNHKRHQNQHSCVSGGSCGRKPKRHIKGAVFVQQMT